MNPLLASLNRTCDVQEARLRHVLARYQPKLVPTPILCACGNLLAQGKRWCFACSERARKRDVMQRTRKQRNRRKAEGRCQTCGRLPLATKTLCQSCREHRNAASVVYRRQLQLWSTDVA